MNNARAFNPFLCARTDKLKDLIAEVQKQIEGHENFHKTRKRARRPADQVTFARTIEAIICDLCAVEVGLKNDSIHLPLSNQILRSKSRYKGTALGKTLPDILKVMSAPEMSFVVVEKGHNDIMLKAWPPRRRTSELMLPCTMKVEEVAEPAFSLAPR
jgi:hypothetical protein